MNRRLALLIPLLLAGVVMLMQYMGSETFVNPETGEARKVALSPEQEEALGLQAFQEVLSNAEVIRSGPEYELVRRVAERLAGATGNSGANFEWMVSLVDSPQVNAFCLPGGKIVVYTGILPIASTEAGLATVMGHEMAHATCRHSAQRMFKQQMTQIGLMGAQGALGSSMDPESARQLMAVLGAGAQYGIILPFSRDHESEADLVGLLYMARAGYDPRESISFWERMADMSNGREPPEYASTHPAHETRIEGLRAAMSRALAEYEQARKAR